MIGRRAADAESARFAALQRLIRSMLAIGFSFAVLILMSDPSGAGALIEPETGEQTDIIEVKYRFGHPLTGRGLLEMEWSDAVGRIVERRNLPLDLDRAAEIGFPLDLNRSVTAKNRLAVRVSLDATDPAGNRINRQEQDAAAVIVSPPGNPWSDYQIIMWQRQTKAGYAALKRLGVTAGMVESDRLVPPGPHVMDQIAVMLDSDLRWYLENIATDFYSPYHKWYANRPVNWRFSEAKQRYQDNPQDPAALMRDPSLSDPEWLRRIGERVSGNVRALHRYRPLFYNLGDEPGIADLSAFWDFDLSAPSLAEMRLWLRGIYGTLGRLNEQWGGAFADWDEVVPMLTRDAVNRTDQNFSAWGDFKEWMDVAFARAVKAGTDAVHAGDRKALSAIGGVQIPGWGGYDYSRLASSVDVMELYHYGENVEILRSFNPNAVMLTTSFRSGPAEVHRIWREFLRGSRGLIIWDEKHEFVDEAGAIRDRGRELAPVLRELRNGLGALLINSRRHFDPIGIFYSPASMRIQWLLDRRARRDDWLTRNASSEYQDTGIRISSRNFARAIEHMGLQPRFVSSSEVEGGALRAGNYRTLIMPYAIALSAVEVRQIRNFVAQGGTVIAEGVPGLFDEHGRKQPMPLLSDIFSGPLTRASTTFPFGAGQASYFLRFDPEHRNDILSLTQTLAKSGVQPALSLRRLDGGAPPHVETYTFRDGRITILALQRDFQPLGSERIKSYSLTFRHPFHVYDLRRKGDLGQRKELIVELDPVEPTVLALSEQPLPQPSISGSTTAQPGNYAKVTIQSGAAAIAGRSVMRLDVIDPDGDVVEHYSDTLMVAAGAVTKLVPFAVNDKPGIWSVRATDQLNGQTVVRKFQLKNFLTSR